MRPASSLRGLCQGRRQRPGGARGPAACLAVALCAFLLAFVCGCGGGVAGSSAKTGPIVLAGSANAADGSILAVGATLRLSMTPAGDPSGAGVDWTVTCSGNPVTGSTVNGACGTLSPAHTADGAVTVLTAPSVIPVGATVTLTANLSADPSATSSARLSIVNSSIAVSFLAAPPASLQVNTSQVLQAQVTNDPTGAGLIWTASCAAPACGSFDPTITPGGSTTYTAPSVVPDGGTVAIRGTSLTDTTKSATALVTITGPPAASSIGVAVSPGSLYVQTVGAAHNGHFTATVTGDASGAGVDWSLACGSAGCGSISSHTASGEAALYSAPSSIPPGGTVTVTARATANAAAMATATADIITAAPIVATFSPAPPTSLTAAASATLAATVTNDPANAGLDWTATCEAGGSTGACGSFNLSPAHTAGGSPIVYTAPATVPAGGLVTLTATPTSASGTVPANPAIAPITILAAPPVITLTQAPPATLTAATQASITASVAEDAVPGGVTWSIAPCGSNVPGGCGWLSPVQTASGSATIYTAPPATAAGTSVTLVATSSADPSVTLSTAPIAIVPATALSVRFIPALAAQLQPGGTVNLQAAVANDTTQAGVDWQVCASGCGFFTIQPAIAAVPATSTTPYQPPVAAVTATSVTGWSNGLPIPYTAPAVTPDAGVVTVAASAHADHAAATSGNIAVGALATGPALTGLVQAGAQPVSGSSVALFAAGATGYGSQASQLASTLTDAQGSFTLPTGYACPAPTSQMYLVATGGAAGAGATANPNLALMTILGSCSALSASPVVLNEVTSVASAYVASPFAANDALTGNPAALYLGASSTNQAGLANAFASVNNLVDIATGQARFVSPAGNAAVPYAQINTLADSLHACAASAGGTEGDGSPCGDLFAATDVLLNNHVLYNAIGPGDTLQAAFNLAQHPVSNYGYVNNLDLSLAGAGSPFQPILPAAPGDWSLSLHYTGGGGGYSSSSALASLAIDASGNLWFTDSHANTVIEWNTFGAAISPATGFAAGGGPLAIDASGNVWISGNGALTELTALGSPVAGSPFVGVPGGGVDMAIDAAGDVWIAGSSGVNEWNSLGVELSPAGGFANGLTAITSLGVDSTGDIWAGNGAAPGNFAELTNPGGGLIVDSSQSLSSTVLPELAADASGDMWGASANGVCEVTPYGGRGSLLIPRCYGTGNQGPGAGQLQLFNPQGVALDGAGVVWLASQGGGASPTISPSVLPIAPGLLASNSPNPLASPSLAAGTLRVAVDGSGNVWVLLADNTVAEYVGAATPVVTPLALGVQSGRLAAKP